MGEHIREHQDHSSDSVDYQGLLDEASGRVVDRNLAEKAAHAAHDDMSNAAFETEEAARNFAESEDLKNELRVTEHDRGSADNAHLMRIEHLETRADKSFQKAAELRNAADLKIEEVLRTGEYKDGEESGQDEREPAA